MPTSSVLTFRGPEAASRATAALGSLVVAALLALALLSAWHLRAEAAAAAQRNAEDQAHALATHASQALEAADLVADSVARSIASKRLANAAELERQFGSLAEHQMLAARQSSFQGIDVVLIVGASGRLINTSRTYPPPIADMSHRESFQVAKSRAVGSRKVGEPVPNRVDGNWTFHVWRQLEDDQGHFMGLVLVGLSPKHLADFYAEFTHHRADSKAEEVAITLLRSDGVILARAPFDGIAIGRVISTAGPYGAIGIAQTHQFDGAVFEPWDARSDAIDHVRLVAREVGGFPLALTVAVDDAFYLAAWRRQAKSIAGFTAIAVVFLTGTFITLFRVLRRRERYLQEVERLRIAAEAASRAKTDFLATVSHEVRTPLNGILGTADLLVRSGLEPRQEELAGTLLTSGRNLLAIINDILDLSKIEADELDIDPAPFSPRELVHEVLSLFASYASSKGLGLSMHTDNEVPAALAGDAKRIKQVVGNLVSNAIKFSDTGTVHVEVTWPVRDNGIHVLRFDISDTGVGIAPEAKERLFQPFAQADGSVSRRFGGTGLGLAISKRLITLMGGQIDFVSAPGTGTCFWVELPLPETAGPMADAIGREHSDWTFAHSGAMPLAPVSDEPMRERGENHVLVVEDNTINAMVVEAQLHRLGCSCDIAADGEEALQRLSSSSYSLVLMDCMLPGISGFEATRRWRAIETERAVTPVPIVALTANALASNLEKTREVGMDDFLTKPCTLDKLEAALRLWLRPGGSGFAQGQPSEAAANATGT